MNSTVECLKPKVYYACKTGMSVALCNHLVDLDPEKCNEVLHSYTKENEELMTPLVVAAVNGHENVIRALLKYEVNLNITGNLYVDGSLIREVTPLWCAAGGGHLGVVKILIHAGAKINHFTKSKSTPLRAACYIGRLDIVKYLISHNADVHAINNFHNNCLMLSAYKGFINVVKLLIEAGIDVNRTAKCGATALHFAARSGHVDIVQELLKSGAEMLKDRNSLTPLMAAAEKSQVEVVEYFLTLLDVSREDKIDVFELLGASLANCADRDSFASSYYFLHCGLVKRFNESDEVLRKPDLPLVPAYGNRRECQTLEQLQTLRFDRDVHRMEGLIVRERILGRDNPEVANAVEYTGAIFADRNLYSTCLDLWKYALVLRRNSRTSVSVLLFRFAQIFCEMLQMSEKLSFDCVLEVLEHVVEEVNILCKGSTDAMEENNNLNEIDSLMLTGIYLIMIVSRIMKEKKSAWIFPNAEDKSQWNELRNELSCQEMKLKKIVYKFIRCEPRNKMGQTLLHLVVNPFTPLNDFYIDYICKFPCAYCAKLLITCGAKINVLDMNRNTPLHLIVPYENVLSDFFTLHNIIMMLLENGAHTDVVNERGDTPQDAAFSGVAQVLIRSKESVSLQCQAARAIMRFGIMYKGTVPRALESFVELHGLTRPDLVPSPSLPQKCL